MQLTVTLGAVRASYILVLAHPRGLAWVLENERMAWQQQSANVGRPIEACDCLFIYASRGALPSLSGTIIGEATALEALRRLEPAEPLGTSLLTHGFSLRLDSLVRPEDSVTLRSLVPKIAAFGYH